MANKLIKIYQEKQLIVNQMLSLEEEYTGKTKGRVWISRSEYLKDRLGSVAKKIKLFGKNKVVEYKAVAFDGRVYSVEFLNDDITSKEEVHQWFEINHPELDIRMITKGRQTMLGTLNKIL